MNVVREKIARSIFINLPTLRSIVPFSDKIRFLIIIICFRITVHNNAKADSFCIHTIYKKFEWFIDDFYLYYQ